MTSIHARFWAKVNKTETCWLWTARTLPNGYGVFTENGKTVYAHRWSHQTFNGPIPETYQVDHVKARGCINRNCVNPDHLEAVPAKVNNLRSDSPAAVHAAKSSCPRGHEYTPENTFHHGISRYCRTCRRDRKRERRALARVTAAV